jgi:hypothetical protein
VVVGGHLRLTLTICAGPNAPRVRSPTPDSYDGRMGGGGAAHGDNLVDLEVLDRLADALGDPGPVRAALDRWMHELPGRLEAIRSSPHHREAALALQSPSAALGLTAVAQGCAVLAAPGARPTPELVAGLEATVAATEEALASW